MAVNLSPYGGVGAQFLDNAGNVLTGGKIFTYAAGTTTNQATYTSSNGVTFHPNPIILDASGRVPSGGEIWLTDGLLYKFVLETSTGVLIATYDNIAGINSNFVNFTNQQEIQTATAGQTVFTLTTTQYQPGTNSLSVFVDGVNQYGPGALYAYLETNSTTVTFVNGLHVGAEVKFTTSQSNSSGGTNASVVVYDPAGIGAVATTVQAKLRETVSVKDFGAVGDGVTDDTTAFVDAFAAGTTYVPDGSYDVDNLSITNAAPRLFGSGEVKTSAVGEIVLSVGGAARLSGAVVDGVTFSQPNDPTMSGGTANNHFCLKLFATDDSRISNLKFVNPDLCLGFEYGAIALGDRSCFRNVVSNVVGYGVRGMGLQLFGSKQGTFTNLTFEGTDFAGTPGSRAQFHGLRLNALGTSTNLGNIVELSAKNFGNGVAVQQNSYYNTVTLYAENCTNAVQVQGQPEGVSTGVSTNNVINVTAKDCGYAVYEGGSSNIFNINADGCTTGGILANSNGGVSGLAENNRYTGTIRNTVGRLADLRSSNSSFDLVLDGVGATSTFGLILQGDNNSGRAVVNNCNVGVRVTGNNNTVDVSVSNSVNNAVEIAGNNNTITGFINGTVTNTGTGNSFNASGTFVPSLIGSTTAGTYTPGGGETGTWVREGRYVRFFLRLNGTIAGQSGTLMVTGLPFSQNQTGYYFYRNETAVANGFAFPRTISGTNATQISLDGQTYTSGNDIYISGIYTAE
jgi:hypothetical protein